MKQKKRLLYRFTVTEAIPDKLWEIDVIVFTPVTNRIVAGHNNAIQIHYPKSEAPMVTLNATTWDLTQLTNILAELRTLLNQQEKNDNLH